MPERGPPTAGGIVQPRAVRARRRVALLCAALALLLIASAQARAATVAEQLGRLPVVQQFTGDASSTAAFAADWTAFPWASAKGSDTTTGWRPVAAYPTEEAAYRSAAQYASASAAAVTLNRNPGLSAGRFFSLWIDAATEALNARTGYELRFTATGTFADAYDVTLSKWQSGTRTVLASQAAVTLVNGNAMAIADEGGTVTAWTDTGSGFTQLASARDASFDQGYVGLGGSGNIERLTGFKVGHLAPAAPVLTGTSPPSPANENDPLILGTAGSGTTVTLYADAACTGLPVAVGTDAELASPGIMVSVANDTTTSFSATAADGLGNVSDCSRAISYTETSTSGTGIPAGLEGLATLDALATPENPLSGGGRWSKLPAAIHAGQVTGSGTTGGWGPWEAFPSVHGAYWNPTTFRDAGAGVAVAATLSVSPSWTERYFSLWLDMPDAARAQTGYELRFTNVDNVNRYDVTLTKWQAGARTVLARQSGYTLAPQSSFALVDQGGTLSAWVNAGSGYSQLLSASDATFDGGSVGIESAGNITRVRQFRAGVLPGGGTSAFSNLDTLDSFAAPENPLSGGGAWTKLSSAAHAGQVAGSGQTGGWGPYNAFPTAHGAYWNQATYGDDGDGVAVAATLSVSPSATDRYFSLWLDMPEPDRAQTGYEARFTNTATTNVYTVTLSKWQAGVRTVLARTGFTLPPQSSFALRDRGGTVSIWTDVGTGYSQLLSADDASYDRGYVGIEGAGNITRVRELRAGASTTFVGQGEFNNDPATGTYTYIPQPGAPVMTGRRDAIGAHHAPGELLDGAEQPLPDETDPVVCATSGHRIKIVYSSGTNDVPSPAIEAEIRNIIERTNSKIMREALRSSGNTRALAMRVDCDANGAIRIYSVRSVSNNDQVIIGTVGNALGLPVGAESVKYLIFRDARLFEGLGGVNYSPEDADKSSSDVVEPGASQYRVFSDSALVYRGPPGENIWATHTPMHELGHALGATAPGSPHRAPGGHCADGLDVMCYEQGNNQYRVTACPVGTERGYDTPLGVPLDCNYDSYFDAAPEPGEWLATHWNIGGPENPFLVERPIYETTTGITLREVRDGPPGSVSVYGHVNTVNAGGQVVTNAFVNVNFQKWDGDDWETLEEHTVHPIVTNGYFEANSVATLGVGRWRLRAVLPRQLPYLGSESPSYHEFEIDAIPTTAFITLDRWQNGAPGTASLHGHVKRTGNEAPVPGRVKVNFQKLVSGRWETMSTADRTLDGNGYWEVVDWGVGVGSWRVRAVFDQQDGYAYAESEYRTFDIQPVPTEAPITLVGFQNGTPGTASLQGHIRRASNRAPASGRVKVNFQKLVGGTWTTMSTADRTLDANGFWEVTNWGVGVGSWRARAVFDQQGDYAYVESEYRTFDIQPVPTYAPITLDGWQNGAPGTATLHGHVLRVGNNAPARGNVNVNFQKWNGSSWQTMSTAQRTLDGNGYWGVSNWGVGVGSWRVRAVFDAQGDYAYTESEYRSFDIQQVATSSYLTVNQVINGSPGRVSVSGNTLWAGGGACCGVNVNFQKLINGTWTTQSTATPGLSNGSWSVSNWGVGVGSWRVRSVFNAQGDFAYSESPYHGFTINR